MQGRGDGRDLDYGMPDEVRRPQAAGRVGAARPIGVSRGHRSAWGCPHGGAHRARTGRPWACGGLGAGALDLIGRIGIHGRRRRVGRIGRGDRGDFNGRGDLIDRDNRGVLNGRIDLRRGRRGLLVPGRGPVVLPGGRSGTYSARCGRRSGSPARAGSRTGRRVRHGVVSASVRRGRVVRLGVVGPRRLRRGHLRLSPCSSWAGAPRGARPRKPRCPAPITRR